MKDCYKCEHYYVTWDKNFPHGCRAMMFKSRRLPGMVVRSSTPGTDCLSYKKKGTRSQFPNKKEQA
ncbi:MAG: uracil-DNA glycosylase [Thermodesulfobacteriota bacterium]|nr:uracil-DNA glycosylase [Thermodesulfobacteriota bacterium]